MRRFLCVSYIYIQRKGNRRYERNAEFYKRKYSHLPRPVCAAGAGGVIFADDVRCGGYAGGGAVCHGCGCFRRFHRKLADAADYFVCGRDCHGYDSASWPKAWEKESRKKPEKIIGSSIVLFAIIGVVITVFYGTVCGACGADHAYAHRGLLTQRSCMSVSVRPDRFLSLPTMCWAVFSGESGFKDAAGYSGNSLCIYIAEISFWWRFRHGDGRSGDCHGSCPGAQRDHFRTYYPEAEASLYLPQNGYCFLTAKKNGKRIPPGTAHCFPGSSCEYFLPCHYGNCKLSGSDPFGRRGRGGEAVRIHNAGALGPLTSLCLLLYAQNMGAGRMERAKRALLCGIGMSLVVGVFMAWLSFFHGDLLAGLFARDEAVIAAAADYLKAYAIDCLLVSV